MIKSLWHEVWFSSICTIGSANKLVGDWLCMLCAISHSVGWHAVGSLKGKRGKCISFLLLKHRLKNNNNKKRVLEKKISHNYSSINPLWISYTVYNLSLKKAAADSINLRFIKSCSYKYTSLCVLNIFWKVMCKLNFFKFGHISNIHKVLLV